jgi:hypothetical protein
MTTPPTKQRPVQCVTCRQPVPESTEQLNYFAQSALKAEADDVENFLTELRDITRYIEALFILLTEAPKSALDDNLLSRSHHLGWSLAQEARQRVELVYEAQELREKRLAPESAVINQAQAKKEG